MSFFDTVLGKKSFCQLCGAPIRGEPVLGDNQELLCGDGCKVTLARLTQPPPAIVHEPAVHRVVGPIDVFGMPECTVHVFRNNDAGPYFALLERIVQDHCDGALRVERLEGRGVALVAVVGPAGSTLDFRSASRANLGPLMTEERITPTRVRPDATYTNVDKHGNAVANDPSILAVCERIRDGDFTRVFVGPPSKPPSSAQLRLITPQDIVDRAFSLIDRHVAFFQGGVLKVEADGVSEAAHLFGEAAHQAPESADYAFLEAAAFALAMRRDLADEKLAAVRARFPDHLGARILESSGQSLLSYPPWTQPRPVPPSVRERARKPAIVMVRMDRRARPVLFVEDSGHDLQPDTPAAAYAAYVEAGGVPIVGVAVALGRAQDAMRIEAIVPGFEEREGTAIRSPRAQWLFAATDLCVVLMDASGVTRAVKNVAFEGRAHRSFLAEAPTFMSRLPKAFGPNELAAALDHYHGLSPLDGPSPT